MSTWSRRNAVLVALGVFAIRLIALRRALGIYFLSDDFILVKFGSEWTAAAFRYSMTHGGGDGFFRPLGYASFALDARLGWNPIRCGGTRRRWRFTVRMPCWCCSWRGGWEPPPWRRDSRERCSRFMESIPKQWSGSPGDST